MIAFAIMWGVQYACNDYTARLADHDIQPSMSRIGNPYDNAKAERFMRTLKEEEIDGTIYRDVEDARNHIAGFLDQVYNQQRLHSALDYQTPAGYEENLSRTPPPLPAATQWLTANCP